MEQDDKDWGNVRFRRRTGHAHGTPEDNASARFVIKLKGTEVIKPALAVQI